MASLVNRPAMAALAACLLSGVFSAALDAQNTQDPAFPANRVRWQRPDPNVVPPDPLYLQNRVVFRSVNLRTDGYGLELDGEVFTDFDADKVPSTESKLPRGPLKNLKIDVELYYWATVLERDKSNPTKILDPKIDPRQYGTLIAGQSVIARTTEVVEGYAMAKFQLPKQTKPLPPGVYRLVARVRFDAQEADVKSALKWCSDIYGAESDFDVTTNQVVANWVMDDPKLHAKYYDELLNTIRSAESVTTIYIGEILKGTTVTLVAPAQGNARTPANHVVWTPYIERLQQLADIENTKVKLDEYEAQVRANNDMPADVKERVLKQIEEDRRSGVQGLLAQYGGASTREETRLFQMAVPAKAAVLEQIFKFEEYLSYRFWVIRDGVLSYGWHRVNHPCYQAWNAIKVNDIGVSSRDRRAKLEEARNAEGGLDGRWTRREEAWKFQPKEIKNLAFAYLKEKEERDIFDAEKFCKVNDDKKVELNYEAMAAYRTTFIDAFIKATKAEFEQVITTERYSIQVWPNVLAEAMNARDHVCSLLYAWEYNIRVDVLGEDKNTVLAEWRTEANSYKDLALERYSAKANGVAPGTLKSQFDGYLATIDKGTGAPALRSAFRVAIEAGKTGANMPGTKPASAPK